MRSVILIFIVTYILFFIQISNCNSQQFRQSSEQIPNQKRQTIINNNNNFYIPVPIIWNSQQQGLNKNCNNNQIKPNYLNSNKKLNEFDITNRFGNSDSRETNFYDDNDRPVWNYINLSDLKSKQPTLKTPSLFHHSNINTNFITTTERIITTTNLSTTSKESPNSCLLVIISCCSIKKHQIILNCLERLGCSGSFWDQNPCNTDNLTNVYKKFLEIYHL